MPDISEKDNNPAELWGRLLRQALSIRCPACRREGCLHRHGSYHITPSDRDRGVCSWKRSDMVQKQIGLFKERMKETFATSRELEILQTLPEVGFILAVVILLEVGDIGSKEDGFVHEGISASFGMSFFGKLG